MQNDEMKVTYIDPDQRALYVDKLPDGRFGVWAQNGKKAARRLVSPSYIKPEGYQTYAEARNALGLYVSNKRVGGAWARWDVLVNGKNVSWDDYHAMCRGELPLPLAACVDAPVLLANIEYRIATHMQGAYENILEVGRCLIEAKEAGLVPHGQWEAWVRHNTGMSERNAQKLMQAARCVQSGSAMERLPISKIQAILALPEADREPMAEKAAADGLTLRDLQEEVRKQKERANKADERARQSEIDRARVVAALRAELEQAKQNALSSGISPEAQAEIEHLKDEMERMGSCAGQEIDRLKSELAEAESYAERQAELRQKAQQELLNRQAQAVRGDTAQQASFSVGELAAAVRAFIGTAGVLPHLGPCVAQISAGDREQMRQYVDMVDAWVDGARRALSLVVIHGEEG